MFDVHGLATVFRRVHHICGVRFHKDLGSQVNITVVAAGAGADDAAVKLAGHYVLLVHAAAAPKPPAPPSPAPSLDVNQ